MLPFRKIYFDSNALIGAGWPNASTSLQNVSLLARLFKLRPILLDVVERELEAHCLRDLEATKSKTLGRFNNLQELGKKIGLELTISIPESAEINKAYQRTVDTLVGKLSLSREKATLRSVFELFEMAIRQVKPFQQKGAGFQDAVISLASIDHLAQSGEKTGAFVSRDNVFSEDVLKALAAPIGVQMLLYQDLEELLNALSGELEANLRGWWRKDEQKAAEAVGASMPTIASFIEESLEVPQYQFFIGEILRINKIEPTGVGSARTPAPWQREQGKTFSFSCDTPIKIHAIIRRPSLPLPDPRMVKLGSEPRPRMGAISAALAELGEEPQETTLNRTVGLEILAKDGQYENLEPASLKLK